MNQIYRSNTDRKIAGVCGGIGEYLSISPDVVRILFLLGSLMIGLRYGFIIYIVSMLLMPQLPEGYSNKPKASYNNDSSINRNIVGIVLIALGIVLTLKRVFRIDDIVVISIILIAVGIYIITKGGKNNEKK